MDHTARTSATTAPARRTQASGRRATDRAARTGATDDLHGSLDAAWQAVNEVARLVDEIHRRRRPRIR